MTYCAGWKIGDAAFLIADSAITRPTPPFSTQSSFGQAHRQVRDEHVEEGLLKVAPIGENAAIAFAGDVGLAQQILELLVAHWPSFGNDLGEVHRVLSATFPLDRAPDVAFLLAWRSDTGPRLSQWESRHGFTVLDGDSCAIGSIGNYHRTLTSHALQQIRNLNVPQEDVLPAITALVQSFGVHDDLIEQNVGGAVFGLAVDSDGVHWQSDTGYLIYSCLVQQPEFVSASVRDNTLVIHSSITRETIAMMNSAAPDLQTWLATWDARIAEDNKTDHFSIVVCIRREDRLITVIEREPGRAGPFMRFRFAEGQRMLDFTKEIGKVLDQPLEPTPDGLPFKLVFLREP
jgi:hypothetical protein